MEQSVWRQASRRFPIKLRVEKKDDKATLRRLDKMRKSSSKGSKKKKTDEGLKALKKYC